ncbi:Connector enhancer of kinase suppressor of ras 2 [Camelus dromedarius]|uniref:Connector enhancer of kinase suppressor of ras 2 n=1 Tax=Camelus dromedarius TaxID=9838 RepID=A0A5N4C2L4_CAMDR|nr:Connector enhancer of kinase suppressor of ras 2 [Camelus dromedarius]
MLLLAYGSSFGDAAANEEYRRIGAIIYANCILALTREFPVIRCNTCHHPTTIVSVSPTFQYRCAQDVSDEFIYFRPIDAEVREEARKQKHRKSTRASHRHTREGIHQRDLGIISQVVMVTTLLLTKQLESIALIRPKTSGFLHLEKMSVKSPRVPESQLLEVTGIASPEERGKGAAIFVAGVPGDEELDDTEIPILKCTELVHLESLINKCSPSSEHSCPQTPRNLWLESPENAEFQGGDDLEVARSMYPFRERPILRRSWEELLEAPLNSEGLHILQTTPTEEREIDYLQLPPEEENQATTSLRAHHLQALQGPFPLHPQHPKLQRQRSHSLPRYSDVRSRRLNAPELTLNPEETWFFFPSDHTLLPGENAKESDSIEEAWQKTILSASGEHPPINPSFEKSSAMRDKIGIPGDNTRLPRGNVRVSRNNVIIPQINVGVPMGNVGVSMNNARIPMDNTAVTLDNSRVPRGSGGVPMGNLEVPRGNYGLPRGSGVGIPMGSVETLRNNAGTSRRIVAYPLTELSKIGEHRV